MKYFLCCKRLLHQLQVQRPALYQQNHARHQPGFNYFHTMIKFLAQDDASPEWKENITSKGMTALNFQLNCIERKFFNISVGLKKTTFGESAAADAKAEGK